MSGSDLPTVPLSRVPDPAGAPPLRWGVLAPGGIAGSFVTALAAHTSQRVVAVASRSADRAAAFARDHAIERSYGSYDELVDDPEVDVVYVASPHSEHHAQALLAVAAGKHVLVEKAFTRNASEAADVVNAARAVGVMAMEAMWARFQPQTDVIRQLLADGALGEVATVLADHGQHFRFDPTHRLFDPNLAGGALLDLGVYPVSLASLAMGRPERVVAVGALTATGVDAQVSVVLTAGTVHAVLNATLLAKTPTAASISGSAGRVELSGPFYAPGTLCYTPLGGRPVTVDPGPIRGSGGLAFEAAELARCVAEGRLESPLLPLAETLAVMRTMDEVRRQIGVTFPGE
jgi:predicted dehydrogenase